MSPEKNEWVAKVGTLRTRDNEAFGFYSEYLLTGSEKFTFVCI